MPQLQLSTSHTNVKLSQPTTPELDAAATEFGAAKEDFSQMYKTTLYKLKAQGIEIGGYEVGADGAPETITNTEAAKVGGQVDKTGKKKRTRKVKREAAKPVESDPLGVVQAARVEVGTCDDWELI
jgi:hypothetical protein